MASAKRPLIGLSAGQARQDDWGENPASLPTDQVLRHYGAAVARAGGLPLVIPFFKEPLPGAAEAGEEEGGLSICGPEPLFLNAKAYLKTLDGLVLTGGGDVGPDYSHTPHPLIRNLDRVRDHWETALLGAALELKKPVLGICRGIQLINVALGGSLWDDLASQRPGAIDHEQGRPRQETSHSVSVNPEGLLAEIAKGAREIKVNSGHHQGIKQLAPGLKATALAPDGLVEALEKPDHPFLLGLQWHPEALSPLDATSRRLFEVFVAACA